MTQRKARRQRRVTGGSAVSIHVRTTVTTYTALVARAAVAGLSILRYLVESALRDSTTGWSLREQRWWAERLDTVETRLIRIGTNLNQMATVANSTGDLPPELPVALAYFTATLEQHRAVLAAIDPADSSREREL
ncbi:plasmid mobilization protein [Saccharothrix australiensis]|uniref:Mobilization protein MobC n=1 Tax=Saccharothrix australiensis TaxID=2072 RepID=A0A495VW45_9PSEU|nr:plasmid mobilization relaxosome protein MobC [Saccharothrix australiensis]RKT53546.1 mobilization protein MobC [Saccharothrix australiensis]